MILIVVLWALAGAASAENLEVSYPQVKSFFSQADRFGLFEGEPRAAPVYQGDTLLGYVFLTDDVVRIPAYSGQPINTLVGFDLTGRITGLAIVHHEEPILAVGISQERLRQFTDQYRGKSVFDRITVGAKREGYLPVDTIAGATITVMVQNATVMRSARLVAESRGLRLPTAVAEGRAVAPTATPAPSPGVEPARVPRPDEPLWVILWRERVFQIVVLVASLACLTAILVFQDWLTRRPKLMLYARNGFLVYTVFFLGWYALAQLSVINVLTFVHSAMRDFRWEYFLIDPMLFILWSYVAATLLLWGRGVYCGWLCPFGALQELVNKIAQRFKLPQLDFPEVVHERLWAVKYIVLIVLFGISLQSMGEAAVYAEVEPFKTTFGLRFHREWPFVAYALGLVVVSAFNRKFFCKYLCALGAALAIPGRFRLFDWWLRRRKECGRPCQTCAHACPIHAIRQTGEINANECHYCLDCQVIYYSDTRCPPLIERRKRRQQLPRAREVVRELEASLGRYGGEGPLDDRERGNP